MLFALYDQRLPSYGLFFQTRSKIIECIQNQKLPDTWHTSTTVPLEAQINALFVLRSTVSELWSVLSKLGQMSLSASTVKSDRTPHTSTTVTIEAQINSLFALQSMVCELWTVLSSLGQRSLSAPDSKVTRHLIQVLLYPLGLKLTLFSVYDQRFPSYVLFCPNYVKGHWVHP